jgi:type II secretory pathway pseudopilin PulG
MLHRGGVRGLGLLETLLALSLFALVGVFVVQIMSKSAKSWQRVLSEESATLQVAKAYDRLQRDLQLASIFELDVRNVPKTGDFGEKMGSAVWFLSAVDPATGQQVRTPAGEPFWQRNIVYYLVVPSDHDNVFGMSCTPKAHGTNGLDNVCPHKVLIRKEIDSRKLTSTDLTSQPEKLLTSSEVKDYLTRPTGYDTSSMLGETSKIRDVKLVATNLLYFEAQKNPDPALPGEVKLDLRSAAQKYPRSEVILGQTQLADHPSTTVRFYSVFPFNGGS